MKKVKKSYLAISMIAFCFFYMTSCKTVKQSERAYLDDGEMVMALRKLEKLEISFQLYREGSSGATGGKSSGGCGCN